MKSGDNRITIELPKGLKLVAERNIDPEYQNEIYVGIETPDGIWHQDLAVIRNAYSIDDNLIVNWNPGKFEVLVYANKDDVDYTNKFSVELRDDDNHVSYSIPAIRKACETASNLPIIQYDEQGTEKVVGVAQSIKWNPHGFIEVDGQLLFGGTNETVELGRDDCVVSMELSTVGLG